ncbi:hypothetical protein GCM10018781_46040 [Kitasatospora indigofera]|uniref:Uncharacterized protein n=1 Tax=Kitasatospora indigofera TaxID=67307 RepID=A0A919G2E5_9ACTN|nr:hypothetical protein [Kitasatospora indigofera]GHH75945.1 hypothetical protein GCM10018781_46040 [Kitasatospora indigofera]
MTSGTAGFLVGAALLTLLVLALVVVALGVLATLRAAPYPDEHPAAPPPRITRHGRWELRQLPDGGHEYSWIARQAGHFGPETRAPATRPRPGRHRRRHGAPG